MKRKEENNCKKKKVVINVLISTWKEVIISKPKGSDMIKSSQTLLSFIYSKAYKTCFSNWWVIKQSEAGGGVSTIVGDCIKSQIIHMCWCEAKK